MMKPKNKEINMFSVVEFYRSKFMRGVFYEFKDDALKFAEYLESFANDHTEIWAMQISYDDEGDLIETVLKYYGVRNEQTT